MRTRVLVGIATFFSAGLAGWLTDSKGRVLLAFVLFTIGVFYLFCPGFLRAWAAVRRQRYPHLASLVGLLAGLVLYVLVSMWLLRHDMLPQRPYYDFIANRQVRDAALVNTFNPAFFKTLHQPCEYAVIMFLYPSETWNRRYQGYNYITIIEYYCAASTRPAINRHIIIDTILKIQLHGGIAPPAQNYCSEWKLVYLQFWLVVKWKIEVNRKKVVDKAFFFVLLYQS